MNHKRIIAIYILIAVLLIPASVFADTYGLGSFVSEYRHYMVAKSGIDPGSYQVFCTNVDDPSEIIVVDDEGRHWIHVTQPGKVVRYYTNDYGVTWWSSGVEIGVTNWQLNQGDSQPILESTFTVYTVSGTVFFYQIGRLMVETMRKMDSGILLTNILAGLTLLVGLIVLGISFRKGWAFLQGQLMH